MMHDPQISAKLKFFKIMSHKLNAFLWGFKTDSPMVPFFADVLDSIVCDFLEKIILKDVLHKATNLYQLVQMDPWDENRKSAAEIDIGFAANINDTKALAFKEEARNVLAALLSHLEKSPLKYALVRSAVSLNPLKMANKAKTNFCNNHFQSCYKDKVNPIKYQDSLQKQPRHSTAHSLMW